MRTIHTRREFLMATAAFGAAKTLATRSAFADEAPPETTTIRLPKTSTICLAPFYVADELLRMEGFADIQYVDAPGGFAFPQLVASGGIDFASTFAGSVVYHLDRGLAITVFGGLHVGCYELFAHGPIHKVSDLKGRRVGIQTQASSGHLYVSIMAAHVGLDPNKDIDWVTGANSKEFFAEGKIDAFLAFPPEPQQLRARNIGHTIIKTTVDRPWSQYFCCMPFANRDFVKTYPIATKRVLRALVKAADFCAADPAGAAQRLVDGNFTDNYDYAVEALRDIPYAAWREYDPEDSLRYYALRLREIDMIKSNPNDLITSGIDLRFLNELKRELKA